jgi:hypothetical protein
MPLPLGSELWQLFYDIESDTYVPRCWGKVTTVRGDERFASGRWRAGYPMFGTRGEADDYVAAHPRQTPTAPGTSR